MKVVNNHPTTAPIIAIIIVVIIAFHVGRYTICETCEVAPTAPPPIGKASENLVIKHTLRNRNTLVFS